jgi:hypothetical protein
MPNRLPEFAKVSFREEFSFEICNSYDVSASKMGYLRFIEST